MRVSTTWRARRAVGSAAAVLGLGLLGACATVSQLAGGYRDADRGAGPDGGDGWLRSALERGSYDSALVRLTSGPDAPSDALLGALYAGVVAHYGGNFAASARALARADAIAEDRFTRSVSRGGLSLLTSDLVLPYSAGRTERLLVHYYGVLGYLKQDSVAAAAVEARRLSRLLQQYGEDRSPDEAATHAMLHYVAGVAFDAAGERTDAAVAYRNAASLAGDSALAAAVERPAVGQATAGGPRRTARHPAPSGMVVVVLEQGFVGRRAEESGTMGFDSTEVVRLASGAPDTSVTVLINRRFPGPRAEPDAAAVKAASARGTFPKAGPRPGAMSAIKRAARGGAGETSSQRAPLPLPTDVNPSAPVLPAVLHGAPPPTYLLRIAWPTFVRERLPIVPVGVAVSGDSLAPAPLRYRANLSDAASHDLDRQRTALVARSAARAAAKYWATRLAEKKGGALGGAVANAATALLERADTRSWHLLPGAISVARLTLPVGTHQLTADFPGPGGAVIRVPLGVVTVHAGRPAVLSTRLWTSDTPLPIHPPAHGVI